jgi:hypothetical protein
MKDLIFRIRSSQYLSNNELVAIKVLFINILLFIVGVITVPINILFSGLTIVQVAFPLTFVLAFGATTILNLMSKPRLAMNASIYAFIIVAASFFQTASPIYIYLMIFALLGLLIFYQDFYTFLIYGSAITIFGIIYLFFNFDTFTTEMIQQSATTQIVIYQGTLIIFYVFFLLNFINSEISNERYIKNFLESKTYTKNYIELIIKLKEAINDRDRTDPIYDQNAFQQSLLETSTFLGEIFGFKAKEIQELVEFYLYLHEVDPDLIINKKNINSKTKSFAKQLKRYLIDQNNEFMGLVYELISETKQGLNNKIQNLDTRIHNSFYSSTDRFIATAGIYYYLRTEITQLDKWERTDETLTHQLVKDILMESLIFNYLSPGEINLILDNEELFKRML